MSLQDTILQVVTQTHEAGREAANLSMTLKEKILVEMARKLRDSRPYLQEEKQ